MESTTPTFQFVNNAFLVIVGLYFLWNVIVPFVYKVYLVIATWFKGPPPPRNEFSGAAYWMRLSVTIQECLKEALLDVLHDPACGGLRRNKFDLYADLCTFKQRYEKKLSKEIKPFHWEIMCHKCTSSCDPICLKHGISISESFDLTCIFVLIINATRLPPPSGASG